MRKMTIDKDHHLIGKVTFFHLGIIIISCFVVHSQGMLAAEFREIEAALNKKSSNTERNKETPKGKRENHSRKFSILICCVLSQVSILSMSQRSTLY